MKWICTFLLVLIVQFTFGQTKYVNVVIRDGGKFYMHTVSNGNSLLGLEQIYNCPVEKILDANPGIERGLTDGSLIYIPVAEKTLLHTVQKSETLFGISKMYAVPVDSILFYNPVAESGLKVGQRLKLVGAAPRISTEILAEPTSPFSTPSPNPSVTTPKEITTSKEETSVNNNQQTETTTTLSILPSDSVLQYTVLQGETLYTIAKRFMVPAEELQKFNNLSNTRIQPGQKLKIPLKKERALNAEVRPVPEKTVAPKDTNLVFKRKKWYKIAVFLPFQLDSSASFSRQIANAALDFYMGAQIALDSLNKLGLNADVYFYDYGSNTIPSILAKDEFAEMDLVLAPLQLKEAELVTEWCKQNGVRCLLSVAMPAKILEGNKLVYALSPDQESLTKSIARYVHQLHTSQQIVLIKPTKPEDEVLYRSFLKAFKDFPTKLTKPRIIEADWSNFKSFEQLTSETFVVFLSTDKDKALQLLERYKNSPNIRLIGLKEWVDWKEVSATLSNKFQFTYASTSSTDMKDERLVHVHRQFRKRFGVDMSRTACLGFDAVMQSANLFFLNRDADRGLITSVKFVSAGIGHGMKNDRGVVLKFSDFESMVEW
jgi:LysM repeat protein